MRGSKCCADAGLARSGTRRLDGLPDRPGFRLLVAVSLSLGGLWLHEQVQAAARAPIVTQPWLAESIPLLPWTIWIYLSFFPLVAATAWLVPRERLWWFVASAALAAVVAWTIALLYPVTFDRPPAAAVSGDWHRRVFHVVHAVDPTHVTFPSLHVAVTWICVYLLSWPRRRSSLLLLGIAISLSTLFTRQHQIVDIVGGAVLAALSLALTGLPWRRRMAGYSRVLQLRRQAAPGGHQARCRHGPDPGSDL